MIIIERGQRHILCTLRCDRATWKTKIHINNYFERRASSRTIIKRILRVIEWKKVREIREDGNREKKVRKIDKKRKCVCALKKTIIIIYGGRARYEKFKTVTGLLVTETGVVFRCKRLRVDDGSSRLYFPLFPRPSEKSSNFFVFDIYQRRTLCYWRFQLITAEYHYCYKKETPR